MGCAFRERVTRPCGIPTVRSLPSVGRFAPFKGEPVLRFEYLVGYESDAPKDGDALLTDNEVMKALGGFRGNLHGDVLGADPLVTANALLTKTNRAAARTILVKATLDDGKLDEAVRRCALWYRLNATLLRCA